MGTRNLTIVKLDGEYKIAQYGQWDGYPEGQGMTALKFARQLTDSTTMAEFKRKVGAVKEADRSYIENINKRINTGELKGWQRVYPELSRDTGAEILDMVLHAEDGIKLKSDIAFAADSLFCEWAWLIDLDEGTFEGYEGFNDKRELTPEDRFYFTKKRERGKYHGITLAAKWKLDDLPTNEEFLAAFKKEE